MRLRGQHVPQAPHRAHGQLNCVVSAPVCLFPSRRPQDSLLIRYAVPLRFPGFLFVRAAHLNEVGSGVVSDYNNTGNPISSSSGLKIASGSIGASTLAQYNAGECGASAILPSPHKSK
jgi:hypothetical protein